MLLRDLMREMGVNSSIVDAPSLAPNPFARRRASRSELKVELPHSLDQVGQFEFGERYCIVLITGVRFEVRQLDTLLEVIKSEFYKAETYDLQMMITNGKQPRLVVRPKAVLGRPWGRNIKRTCEQIESWVTQYNLSDGRWPDEAYAELSHTGWRTL